MNNFKNKALVLGMGPTGLGVTRALGRNGIDVIGLDFIAQSPGFKSKYCGSHMLCPHPINGQPDLIKLIIDIGSKLTIRGIIYPTSDEFVEFVSSFREQLETYFLLAMPDKEIVEKFLSKEKTYRLARDYGIAYPQSFSPYSTKELDNIVNLIQYPVFIKPSLTYEWKIAGYSKKGFVAKNKDQLIDIMSELLKKKLKMIVQSIISGPVENLYEVCCYIGKHEKDTFGFVKRKIRQFPGDFGLGSFMESTKNDELLRKSVDFLKNIGFKGPAEIEFKKDERDGQFKLIEVNSRLTLQNSLSEACGINFPVIQYYDLVGGNINSHHDYPVGIKWVWCEIDFQAFLEQKANNNIGIFEWIKSIYKADEYAIFSLKDMAPFFQSVNYGCDFLKLPFSIFKKLIKRKDD